MALRLLADWVRGEDGHVRLDAHINDGGSGDMEGIVYVQYVLHPTFPNPVHLIKDPLGGFALHADCRAPFILTAFVQKEGNTRIKLIYKEPDDY